GGQFVSSGPVVDPIGAWHGPQVVTRPREHVQLIKAHPGRLEIEPEHHLHRLRQLDRCGGIVRRGVGDRDNRHPQIAGLAPGYRHDNGAGTILASLRRSRPRLTAPQKAETDHETGERRRIAHEAGLRYSAFSIASMMSSGISPAT